jgi:hypothetical protein
LLLVSIKVKAVDWVFVVFVVFVVLYEVGCRYEGRRGRRWRIRMKRLNGG